MGFDVREISSGRDRASFVHFPRSVFRKTPSWLPEPESDELAIIDPRDSPFHRHADVALYLALRDGTPVGRIAAFVDRRAPSGVGSFGFFDTIDDPDVAGELLQAARRFAVSRGCSILRGPIDFWSILSAGVLVSGFEHPNYIGVRHAMPYYDELLRQAGLESFADLTAWEYGRRPVPPPALGIADAVFANDDLRCIPFDPDDDDHWAAVGEVYGLSYVDEEWYFPITVEELRFLAGERVDPRISFLVTLDARPVAIAIGWANTAQASLRVGNILPVEPIQRIWRTTNRAPSWRQWLFAVAPQLRGRALGGLPTALYVRVRRAASEAGYGHGETAFSAPLAERLTNGLSVLGATHYKTYRLYQQTF